MFCSTVIATIGRPELSRAVDSVLTQIFTAADFEVIVVNDSGKPLPVETWQTDPRVHIVSTQRRERCVARNVGAAIARGKYLHFLDDDDWLLPGAFESLWQLRQTTDAEWLYGGTQLVDRAGQRVIDLRHNVQGNGFIQAIAGEWIPLQSSLIETSIFFAVGGFNPLITGAEDIDLLRRITLRGNLAETPALVACVGMGLENSSTDYVQALNDARQARELILSQRGAFARMRASATTPMWHGRIVRAYLTSAVWNLRRGRLFVAMSRIVFALMGSAFATYRIFLSVFWWAVAKPYTSASFIRGFEAENRPLETRDLHNL